MYTFLQRIQREKWCNLEQTASFLLTYCSVLAGIILWRRGKGVAFFLSWFFFSSLLQLHCIVLLGIVFPLQESSQSLLLCFKLIWTKRNSFWLMSQEAKVWSFWLMSQVWSGEQTVPWKYIYWTATFPFCGPMLLYFWVQLPQKWLLTNLRCLMNTHSLIKVKLEPWFQSFSHWTLERSVHLNNERLELMGVTLKKDQTLILLFWCTFTSSTSHKVRRVHPTSSEQPFLKTTYQGFSSSGR